MEIIRKTEERIGIRKDARLDYKCTMVFTLAFIRACLVPSGRNLMSASSYMYYRRVGL